MPRRDDLRSILVIGSGPIVIGQACEFDYSGTQACRVLTEEGYRVVLANSNPATIMTDPGTADRTYVEPLEPEVLAAIIEKERPDALLPTLGGQTALNLTMRLVELGVLERYGVEVIGARPEAIATAEDRDQFKAAMESIGLEVPRSGFAHSLREAEEIAEEIGYPIMVRPSFILGGKGTGIAPDAATFSRLAAEGLAASPVGQILVERSIAGWKEFELEVMRDGADNCVVVCSIENFDPMGVHTGDSITVAPAQTLTDVEYQAMRDDAFACLRRVGVETGGSNVQFAVDPATGRRVIIEMNPRVSRSSALASKATGFPIAKIAARLAVGYLLNEIPNDITRATPASFEPTIDYVVTKVPRWAFEKLPGADARLGTRMQSVGEVMAIGRTFCESLQKALRSLEQGRTGLNADPAEVALDALSDEELLERVGVATPDRVFELEAALRRGATVDELAARTGIDPWFLSQLARISAERLRLTGRPELEASDFRRAKRLGFSDAQLAYLRGGSADDVRAERLAPWRAGHLQDGRYLRGGVRGIHAVPLRHLRGGGRDPLLRSRPGDHPRLGAQPHRAGDRVRLLLRARLHDAARRRLRDGHGQLQPRDGLDRLRHLGPSLLRAADRRRRGERARRRAGGRWARGGGDRVVGRADAAQAGRLAPARAGPRHEPGLHRPGRGSRAVERAVHRARDSAAGRRHGDHHGGGAGRGGPRRLPGAAAPELRAGRPGHGDRLRRRRRATRHAGHDDRRAGPRGRRHRRAPGAGGPLPGGRGRGGCGRRARRHRRNSHRRGHGARGGGGGALG